LAWYNYDFPTNAKNVGYFLKNAIVTSLPVTRKYPFFVNLWQSHKESNQEPFLGKVRLNNFLFKS